MMSFRKRNDKARVRRLRPRLEGLEDRVTPSTFHVNTVLDTVAVNLNTGTDASGHVSLRSAIMAADAKGGNNKIILPAGDFTLTIPAASGDGNASGDLDIDANVSIQGRGATQTIIDGNNLDRVIAVQGGNVTITGVTIQHGRVVGDGGGILNDGGRLSLSADRRRQQRGGRDGRPRRHRLRRSRRERQRRCRRRCSGRRDLQRGRVAEPDEDHCHLEPGDRRRRRQRRGGISIAAPGGGTGVAGAAGPGASAAAAARAAPAWAAGSSTRPARP